MSGLKDPTMMLLERSLTASLHRQNLITANVANLDTPNFTPSDLDFSQVLADMEGRQLKGVRRTHDAHQSPREGVMEAATEKRPDVAPGLDGNSVDLDAQMGRMAQNGIFYQANTQAISRKLAVLKYVVTEGGM